MLFKAVEETFCKQIFIQVRDKDDVCSFNLKNNSSVMQFINFIGISTKYAVIFPLFLVFVGNGFAGVRPLP